MSGLLLTAILDVVGLGNLAFLWNYRPMAGLIGVIGFGRLALASQNWFATVAVPSTVPLTLASAAAAATMIQLSNQDYQALLAERDAARVAHERLQLAIERVAVQWDGCSWEDCADIGASIRADVSLHLRTMDAPSTTAA